VSWGVIEQKFFGTTSKKTIDLVASILRAKEVQRNRGVFDWLHGDTGMRLFELYAVPFLVAISLAILSCFVKPIDL